VDRGCQRRRRLNHSGAGARVEWATDKQTYAGKAEVIWAKVRDGDPGVDALLFDVPTTSFSEA
jgi:hypothetical protein